MAAALGGLFAAARVLYGITHSCAAKAERKKEKTGHEDPIARHNGRLFARRGVYRGNVEAVFRAAQKDGLHLCAAVHGGRVRGGGRAVLRLPARKVHQGGAQRTGCGGKGKRAGTCSLHPNARAPRRHRPLAGVPKRVHRSGRHSARRRGAHLRTHRKDVSNVRGVLFLPPHQHRHGRGAHGRAGEIPRQARLRKPLRYPFEAFGARCADRRKVRIFAHDVVGYVFPPCQQGGVLLHGRYPAGSKSPRAEECYAHLLGLLQHGPGALRRHDQGAQTV